MFQYESSREKTYTILATRYFGGTGTVRFELMVVVTFPPTTEWKVGARGFKGLVNRLCFLRGCWIDVRVD